MKHEEITVRVALGRGDAPATVWTCDFSHDYVQHQRRLPQLAKIESLRATPRSQGPRPEGLFTAVKVGSDSTFPRNAISNAVRAESRV